MTQYGFYFDSSRCTGCKTCELVCKDYHDLGPDILFRRIYDFEGGSWEKTPEGRGTRRLSTTIWPSPATTATAPPAWKTAPRAPCGKTPRRAL